MATYTVWDTSAVTSAIQETLVKEDVSDLISDLFPLDAPLQQVLGKVPMSSTFTERPLDYHTGITRTAAEVTVGNPANLARTEGATYTSDATVYPARLVSVAQIVGNQFEVSRTDRAVSHYAITDRFSFEALKKTQEVINDFELTFWWGQGTAKEGADITGAGRYARATQGLMHWICKTGLQRSIIGLTTGGAFTDGHGNDFGDTAGNEVLNNTMTHAYDAAGVALDAGMFKERLMEPWWDLTGRTNGAIGFMGGRVKSLFSRFALSATGPVNERGIGASSKRVIDTLDFYETDFGEVGVNLCRYLNQKSQSTTFTQSSGSVVVAWDAAMVFIQPQYFNIGVLRPVGYSPLGLVGDKDIGLIVGEQGLVCTNPQGGAALVNCSGS